ncbi:MAG: HlyD family type I secretion periplasmic adaptor subunit [Desulfuromonadales bacterium]|nr:HlyD family type I secretion periplasmic adaptor subunit [Desulfuromonadales bacterium]
MSKDKPKTSSAPPQARKGLLGFAREEEELFFMSEVDAAIQRKGHAFAYLLSMAVGVLLVLLVTWAHFTVLDEVTRGMGQVIPSRRVQLIQNLEGGILQEILVQENQIVGKGDILVRIDNAVAASQYRDAFAKAQEHEAAIVRLTAEAEDKKNLVFPAELQKADPQILADQQSIFQARQLQLRAELNVLRSQYSQRQQEVAEMQSRKEQLERSLKLAHQQRDIAKPLVDQGVYPKTEYLAVERDISSLQGDIDALRLGIPRVRQSANEASKRIAQRKAEFHAQALDELNRRRGEMNSLHKIMAAGEDRVTRTDVRSPVRGTVKQLMLTTVGGVVRPAESIMEIVPLDDTLLIEARIRPADIAFLHPGQKAVIKITAYDFSIFGGIDGFVEAISADTIEEDDGESFYKVKLRTNTNSMIYRGESLPIIPGMTASIDILTGKKSVLAYLLKPILRMKQNALRER